MIKMGEQVIRTLKILHTNNHDIISALSYSMPVVPAYQMPYPYSPFPNRPAKEFGADYSDPRVYSPYTTVPPRTYSTLPYEHGDKEKKEETKDEDEDEDDHKYVNDSNEDEENEVEVEEVEAAVELGKKTCNVEWSCKLGEFILLLTINFIFMNHDIDK